MKIAVMKVSHGLVVLFGPESIFLIYKNVVFGVFLRKAARTAAKNRTNLSTANGPIGPEVAPPSVDIILSKRCR